MDNELRRKYASCKQQKKNERWIYLFLIWWVGWVYYIIVWNGKLVLRGWCFGGNKKRFECLVFNASVDEFLLVIDELVDYVYHIVRIMLKILWHDIYFR